MWGRDGEGRRPGIECEEGTLKNSTREERYERGLDRHVLCLVAQSCPTLCDPMDCSPPGFSVHGDSPGKNTGVGCHALLQGISPTQGSNPGLPHCRRILYHLNHQGTLDRNEGDIFLTRNIPAAHTPACTHSRSDSLLLLGMGDVTQVLPLGACITPKQWLVWKWKVTHSVVSNSLQLHGLLNSPGHNTGVDSLLSFLQGIFPTQRLNPGLLYCRQILYQLSHQGSPISLGWIKLGQSEPIFFRSRTGTGIVEKEALSTKTAKLMKSKYRPASSHLTKQGEKLPTRGSRTRIEWAHPKDIPWPLGLASI